MNADLLKKTIEEGEAEGKRIAKAGGTAFPTNYAPGMTLRDYFAAKALQALIIAKIGDARTRSGTAYRYANDMLRERNGDPTK